MVNGTIMPTQSGYGFIYINISTSFSFIMKYLLVVSAMRLGSNNCCLGGLASTTTRCRHIFSGNLVVHELEVEESPMAALSSSHHHFSIKSFGKVHS